MLHDPITIAVVGYAAVVLAGIIGGAQDRIVVFADLRDLLTTFAIVLSTAIIGCVVLTDERLKPEVSTSIVAPLVAAAVGVVGWRAWRMNHSLGSTVLAVATKLPFVLGVPLPALQFVVPTGDTAKQRASRRATALLLLMIVAPVLLMLVRDRKGIERYLGVG